MKGSNTPVNKWTFEDWFPLFCFAPSFIYIGWLLYLVITA
jgi:hypothetical protein